MEPPFLAIELRKLLLWLTLECFRRKFVRKQIDWTGRAGASRARVYYNPLLEILDPPLELSAYIVYGALYKILKNTENACKILKNGNIYTERQENSLEALNFARHLVAKDNFHALMACHPALIIIFHGALIRSDTVIFYGIILPAIAQCQIK